MTNNTQNAPSALQISDIAIRQDSVGRYCLNDLHKASGNNQKHRPKYWLESQQTQELIAELESEGGIPPSGIQKGDAGIPASHIVKGNRSDKTAQGTYVVKELVYAYAMWISPAFSLKVIRAYDALHSAPVETPKPEPTPLPPQLRTKILFCIENGVTTQEVVPYGCCVIDAHDLASLKILINDCVPPQRLPELMDLVSLRIGRYFRSVRKPDAE